MGRIGFAIFISILIILLCFAAFEVYILQKPKPGRGCTGTGFVWAKNCLYLEERFKDPTLSSPNGIIPYLVNFEHATGAGNSIFKNCWYRLRYVNTKTGGYSDFSEWTQTAVRSGSTTLPVAPGITIPQGKDSCSFNQPTIGIPLSASAYSPLEPFNGDLSMFIAM